MKQKLIEVIREVPISGKTYEEYIEVIADRLIAEDYRKASEVAREIFEDIERETKNHGITYTQRKIAELKKKYTEEGK